jgi:serralysin
MGGFSLLNAPPDCSDPYAYYYHHNPDVKAANMDAFYHWNEAGYKEGRKSCWENPPDCSDPAKYYYYYNQDVKAAGVDAQQHWNQYGRAEGRRSCWK